MKRDLFASPESQRIAIDGGELVLIQDWLNPAEAERWFKQLRDNTAWEQSSIRMAGKEVRIPRLNAWYGDEGRAYTYSGRRFEALAWSAALLRLKTAVQEVVDDWSVENQDTDFQINSALLNLYRDGNDSVAWHSDDEAELGPRPQIASLSLGATRRFVFKNRRDKSHKLELSLEAGSLLFMLGDIQKRWLHSVPKTRRPVGERINATFRQVFRSSDV